MAVKSAQILSHVSHGEEMTSLPVHQRALLGMGYAPERMRDLPRAHGGNMMIIRWKSAKARRRLQALADGNIKERGVAVFPECTSCCGAGA